MTCRVMNRFQFSRYTILSSSLSFYCLIRCQTTYTNLSAFEGVCQWSYSVTFLPVQSKNTCELLIAELFAPMSPLFYSDSCKFYSFGKLNAIFRWFIRSTLRNSRLVRYHDQHEYREHHITTLSTNYQTPV